MPMKISSYNYAAIALLLILIITHISRNTLKDRSSKSFFILLIQVLLTAIFDSYAVYYDNLGIGHVLAKYLFHGLYLYFHTLTSIFYLIYLISLTDTWHELKKEKWRIYALTIPFLLYNLIFLMGFIGGPRLYYIDTLAGDLYTRGETYYLGYVIGLVYIAYGTYYILRYKALFTTKWLITLFSPYIMIAVAMIIELKTPTMRIELLAEALAFLFIFSNIQKPEELSDIQTGLYNIDAFYNDCKKALLTDKPVTIIFIQMNNYSVMQRGLDYATSSLLKTQTGAFLKKTDKELKLQSGMYHRQGGHYYMMIPTIDETTLEKLKLRLLSYFSQEHTYGNMSLIPLSSFVQLDLGNDIKDFESLISFDNTGMKRLPDGQYFTASELFKQPYYKMAISLEKIITDAIKYDRFEVYYQPIYSIKDQRFNSAEALIRLKDPVYGFVPPDTFIPIAEKTGDISTITDFVFQNVCEFINSEEFKLLKIDYIEVNITVSMCMQPDLADRLLHYLDSKNIPYNRINLEITESGFAKDPEMLIRTLNYLSSKGIGISLDDYGTGYSDTRRIADAPLNIVKFDRGFIRDMSKPKMEYVIRDTIKMLKNLNVQVVAEGVEEQEELDKLIAMGCDYIQGYYYSKPIPKRAFMEFVYEQNKEL